MSEKCLAFLFSRDTNTVWYTDGSVDYSKPLLTQEHPALKEAIDKVLQAIERTVEEEQAFTILDQHREQQKEKQL